MTKVILDLPKGEIVRILAQLPLEEREEIIREVEKGLKIEKEEIAVGGDALIDSERIYDE